MSSILNSDPLPPRDSRPSRALIGVCPLIMLLFVTTVVFLQSQM